MLKLIFIRKYWFKKVWQFHLKCLRDSHSLAKGNGSDSKAEISPCHILLHHNHYWTPWNEFHPCKSVSRSNWVPWRTEHQLSCSTFQNCFIPQAIIYFNSIRDGIIIIRGPGTETNSSFIQSLQQRIKYNLNNIYKQA